jgi:hypothetical protein
MPPHYNAAMPTREELHQLVDTLPEGAVEVAHMFLSRLQVWPPIPQSSKTMVGEMRMRGPQGTPVLSSREGWEDGTYIRENVRNHWGHDVKVVDIRIEGGRLVYKHEVLGPDGKRDEREVVFNILS